MTLQITGNNMNGSPELSLSGGNSTIFAWSPFGGGAMRTVNAASLPGFNGERQDPLSGVTHLGNGYRAYSPALRRFTCPDSESPFGQGGINPYVYCDHDPVNNTDPSGHMPLGKAMTSAEVKAARKQERERKMAESMPTGLPPQPEMVGVASTSAADQRSTGVPHPSRQARSAPAKSVRGIPPKPTDFEMAPVYVWAVNHQKLQRASPKRFNGSNSIEGV
ncbi:TPA: RHS repeat-associated core domain-containing protein [Salmonella enterica]|nr:RHS repeat-associated core domain-containing protein [Salmonella enterica]